ncbi:MAG: NUDIX hydrolase [Acholeplasmatales bacterium]|nr:MAG: NUDIX hydrolase [Acholeplasmatales bacterium]
MKELFQSRRTVYDTDFLQVHEDTVKLPSGRTSTRVVVDHIGAAAVVPLTSEGEVVLVRQYRYALGAYTFEIPAGKKDAKEEDSLQTATRELWEETGYASDDITFLKRIHTAIGFSNEVIDLYFAKDAYFVEAPTAYEEDEYIDVHRLSLSEALEWVHRGKITDAKTVIALLLLEKLLK